jgi:hypothetical protein
VRIATKREGVRVTCPITKASDLGDSWRVESYGWRDVVKGCLRVPNAKDFEA